MLSCKVPGVLSSYRIIRYKGNIQILRAEIMIKERIKELREKNNLTISAFARSLGISPTSVSLYESGRQNPGKKTIQRICEVYGVDEKYLTSDDELTGEAGKTDKEIKAEKKPEMKPEKKPEMKAEKKSGKKKDKLKKKEKKKQSGNKAAIIIQSPEGKDITPKQIRKLVPEGTDYVCVRVDENRLYWVKGSQSGATDIW